MDIFGTDGKRKILIVNILGHIQVAFRKMHGKAGRETVPGSNGREGSPSWETPRPLGARLTITLTNGS